MTDTPQHIKDLQLKIWLSKPPMERLRLTLENNEVLLHFWSSTRAVGHNRLDTQSSRQPGQISR